MSRPKSPRDGKSPKPDNGKAPAEAVEMKCVLWRARGARVGRPADRVACARVLTHRGALRRFTPACRQTHGRRRLDPRKRLFPESQQRRPRARAQQQPQPARKAHPRSESQRALLAAPLSVAHAAHTCRHRVVKQLGCAGFATRSLAPASWHRLGSQSS